MTPSELVNLPHDTIVWWVEGDKLSECRIDKSSSVSHEYGNVWLRLGLALHIPPKDLDDLEIDHDKAIARVVAARLLKGDNI